MKRLFYWWTVHVLHWAVLYGAFVVKAEGAMYILKFWVWLMAPLSLLLLADKKLDVTPAVRSGLSMLQAWVTLGLLVWFGHIPTAIAWGVVMWMIVVHRHMAHQASLKGAPCQPT